MEKLKNATMLIHSLKVDNQVVTDKEHITNHVVEHFHNLFNNVSVLQNFSLVEEEGWFLST